MIRHLTSLVVVAALGLFGSADRSRAADPVRVGILGIDNFGSVAYTEFLNRPHAEGVFEGVRVVAAYPVTSDYPESKELTERWKDQLLKMYQSQIGRAHV